MATNYENIDLRRAPYRGILTELAQEEGVSRQGIHAAIRKWKNPRILTRFMDKVDAVNSAVARYQGVKA